MTFLFTGNFDGQENKKENHEKEDGQRTFAWEKWNNETQIWSWSN